MSRVYEDLDKIPRGLGSDVITEGCLVLEGGAFRGLYTAGVLDAWMQNDINFRCTIGVSAGALTGTNYMAGQIGRTARANLGYRHDSNFVGMESVRKAHSVIRLDFLFKDYNAIEMLNVRRFFDPDRRFVAVATNCDTGKPVYFDRDYCGNIFEAIKASASMPFVTPMVNVDGINCLDGGSTCKIPYQWAINEGYEKIVIVKTRENGFRRKVSERKPATTIYRNHPEFAAAHDMSAENYNRQCDEIDRLSASGRVFVVAPSEPVRVGRVEGDMDKLGHLYWLGYNDGMNILPQLKEYLEK